MLTTTDVRSRFIDFFVQEDHEPVSSSSLVPQNDPTLMFTAAGMVQFKDVFTGLEERPYKRAVTSQKCLRAGGKHNDLEQVGHTSRHHTFFEMLGNFSFGDYFKEQAISLAWTFLIKDLAIPKEKLLITVFDQDEEAAKLWKKIANLSDDKIIRNPSKTDNFWSMGDTGPCGPCSEIFYDHGSHIAGGPPTSPDEDGDRFVEIWNLVFMQYEQLSSGKRENLAKPSIDTGMGLERMTAVLQGVHNNYDIDLFQALIHVISEVTKTKSEGHALTSHRVIADHLRAACFLIADGILPSNEGRGYVLRRIMRRAMRHANILGAKDPVMWKLVPELIAQMGAAFPELIQSEALATETLKLEEGRFQETLERGLHLLNEEISSISKGGTLAGNVAFKLYDTYGFPLDLTQDVLKSEGLSVDEAGFQKAMAHQKAEARAAWAGSGATKTDTLWFELRDKYGATDFLGYETTHAEGLIRTIVHNDKEIKKAQKGDTVSILTNQTPFYGESGGQMGDTGIFQTSSGAKISITDTLKKLGDLHIHEGKVEAGSIAPGETVIMDVDNTRRLALRANHSATHLLHKALKRHLGEHVTQKGSLVAPDRLRFDFSYNKPISEKDLHTIEEEVNLEIRMNSLVTTRLMTPEEAVKEGALALFGEKYGNEVRVVSMGDALSAQDKTYSIELCGGTHVSRTGDIGFLKITSESGIAGGIRRLEAVTGQGAFDYISKQQKLMEESAALLKVTPKNWPEKLRTLMKDKKDLEKQVSDMRKGSFQSQGKEDSEEIGGIKVLSFELQDIPAKDLKSLADEAKKKAGSGVVIVSSVTEGRVSLVIAVTDDLTKKLSAVPLVQKAAEVLGGKGGGGRPDMAQAGGTDPNKIRAAITDVKALIKKA